jgi:hypothetical protein
MIPTQKHLKQYLNKQCRSFFVRHENSHRKHLAQLRMESFFQDISYVVNFLPFFLQSLAETSFQENESTFRSQVLLHESYLPTDDLKSDFAELMFYFNAYREAYFSFWQTNKLYKFRITVIKNLLKRLKKHSI